METVKIRDGNLTEIVTVAYPCKLYAREHSLRFDLI